MSRLTLREIDRMVFVDAPKILSYYKARIYVGRGFDFYCNKESQMQRWERFNKLNDLYGIMFRTVRMMSECGVQALGVLPNEKGEPIIDEMDPWFSSQVEQSFSTNDCAVIISKRIIDNKITVVKCFYDREKIVTTLWDEQTRDKINLEQYNSKLPEDKRINLGDYDSKQNAYVLKHNLGIVPCKVFTNKPFKVRSPMYINNLMYSTPFTTTINANQPGGIFYNEVSDVAACSGLLLQLQNYYSQANKVAILSKPRIIASNISTADMKYVKNDNVINEYLDDILIRFRSDQTKIDISEPKMVLNDYHSAIQSTWSDLFRACGMSWVVNSGTNKTAHESITAFQGSVEEANLMRTYFTKQWKNFIKKMFIVDGHPLGSEEKWIFQVYKNIITDEASYLNNIILQINNGLLSKQEGISELRAISLKEAKAKLDAIVEERKKYKELYETDNKDFNLQQSQIPGSKSVGGAKPKHEKGE